MHPHRILSLLFLLLLSLALGACASHDARPAPEPGAPLPAVTLERGDRVFIKIENGKSMTEDLHSMLTAYLQSERGLNPASDVKEADLVILVEIRDVWATSDGSRVSAGRTLGNVGTGTMLGVLLGGLVDGRGGAIVGAGIGATVGVGATLHDAGDSYTSWAMEAAVGTAARRQGQPAHRCRDQPRQSPQQGRGLRRAGRRPVPGHPGVHQELTGIRKRSTPGSFIYSIWKGPQHPAAAPFFFLPLTREKPALHLTKKALF